MHHRSKTTIVDPIYARTVQGFKNFIIDTWPIPTNMRRPTIGRYDHSIGYVPGNFRWQELSENTKESSKRNNSHELNIKKTKSGKMGDYLSYYLSKLEQSIPIRTLMTNVGFKYRKNLYRAIRRYNKINNKFELDIEYQMLWLIDTNCSQPQH